MSVCSQQEKVRKRIGVTYGNLTILEWLGSSTHRRAIFLCLCSCGEEVIKISDYLNRKNPNCGCISKPLMGPLRHGHSRRSKESVEYMTWKAMHARCYNQNNKGFPYYGAKGIGVCPAWHLFENFLADMGKRPAGKFSIDRLDPEKNYSPDNCRWLLHAENCRLAMKHRYAKLKPS